MLVVAIIVIAIAIVAAVYAARRSTTAVARFAAGETPAAADNTPWDTGRPPEEYAMPERDFDENWRELEPDQAGTNAEPDAVPEQPNMPAYPETHADTEPTGRSGQPNPPREQVPVKQKPVDATRSPNPPAKSQQEPSDPPVDVEGDPARAVTGTEAEELGVSYNTIPAVKLPEPPEAPSPPRAETIRPGER